MKDVKTMSTKRFLIWGILGVLGILFFIYSGFMLMAHDTHYFISVSLMIGGMILLGIIMLKLKDVEVKRGKTKRIEW
jgi:uncharacterized membrane protein